VKTSAGKTTQQINPDNLDLHKKKNAKLRKSMKVWDEKIVNLIYSGSGGSG
jgi:hypothetical protein